MIAFLTETVGIGKERAEALLRAGVFFVREFGKRQVILGTKDDPDLTGILLEGTAFLESVNLENQRRILDYYQKGGVFRRQYFPGEGTGACDVVSQGRCLVGFLRTGKLDGLAERKEWEAFLEREQLARTQTRLLAHVDILGQRTLRQKLMAYFLFQGKGGRDFSLPFSWTDLADYLAVDRSAMTRELGKMKEEGLVLLQGRRVRL